MSKFIIEVKKKKMKIVIFCIALFCVSDGHCPDGYKDDLDTSSNPAKPICLDIDECNPNAIRGHDCDINAKCTNTLGSFDCECNPGKR